MVAVSARSELTYNPFEKRRPPHHCIDMNFQELKLHYIPQILLCILPTTRQTVSGNIQMLILVVKLYVFSDYILRKRVPKSQNFQQTLANSIKNQHVYILFN
jgi:hypothetical protein